MTLTRTGAEVNRSVSRNEDWTIPTGHHECDRCHSSVEVGETVTTVLQLDEQGPRREDLCATCGEDVGDAAIFWRHRRPDEENPHIVVDYALLREAFPHLCARDEPLYHRLAYLVGLVLVRKRMLRLVGFEVRDGKEVMIVTRGAGQPQQVVPAPHLEAEQLVETREQLGRLLTSELPDLGGDALEVREDAVAGGEGDPDAGAESA